MAQMKTSYDVNTGRSSASVPGYSMPEIGYKPYEVDFDPNKLSKEIAYRAWHQQRALSAPAAAAPVYRSIYDEPMARPADRSDARAAAAPAPAPQAAPQQDVIYRKFVNIGNSAGWIPAQAWEPGAVAGGYMPIGQRAPSPTQAAFQDSGPSRASLTQQSQAVQRPTYEEMTGINPYATGLLADRMRGLGGGR